jgi:hypothetical protein
MRRKLFQKFLHMNWFYVLELQMSEQGRDVLLYNVLIQLICRRGKAVFHYIKILRDKIVKNQLGITARHAVLTFIFKRRYLPGQFLFNLPSGHAGSGFP